MANSRSTPSTQGLISLLDIGDKGVDLFIDKTSPAVLPNEQIRAYRGDNLIKSLSTPLGSEEAAGRWYGFTADKASRYPSKKAPSILGGAVTKTMDVSPEEIIQASRQAYYDHGKTAFNMNLENGVSRVKAEDEYYRYLNQVDDWHADKLDKLRSGKLPKDEFDFMLKTTMEEGVFDKTGKIDVAETFRRGNYGIAGAIAAGRALPMIAKGVGIAALPLDLIAGATETGLDAEEELGKAYGVSPSLFYSMDPEQFKKLENQYRSTIAKMEAQRLAEAQTISPMVP
jgi:hypothetical protein